MIKRDFLKLFGAGLASLPFAGKLLREGLPEIKSAAKGIARTLSKVEGMPEWFSPLVNKILKNGKNISPEVKRLEDTVHVRTLKDGDTVFTLTEHPLEGEIRVEIKSPRNPHGEPVELQYKKPKKDFDPDTGKTINEPGEFQVVESEPRWTNSNDPVLELGERVTSVDKAAGDIEAAERAVTGKIKNREKIKERRKIKDQMENNPTDYIDQEYGPEPGFYQQFKNYGDYANGGRVGYGSGGIGLPPISLPVYSDDETNVGIGTFIKNRNNEGRGPQTGFGIGADYGDFSAGVVSPFERGDFKKPELFLNWSKQFKKGGYVSKGEPVNTDLTRTIPPVKGPNPQGVETLFKRRYR